MEQQFALLWQHLSSQSSDWLKTAQHHLNNVQSSGLLDQYLKFSAMAKRKLGDSQIDRRWRTDQLARLLLLCDMLNQGDQTTRAEHIKAAFKFGDEDEQTVIVKALSYLRQYCAPEVLIELALFTGRTNSVNLFAALALNNPFPAQYYDDRAFHQLVLKALFMDLDIAQLQGLNTRHSHTLSQLAMDLVNERLAADRQPPGGIWLAMRSEHLSSADKATYNRFQNNQ